MHVCGFDERDADRPWSFFRNPRLLRSKFEGLQVIFMQTIKIWAFIESEAL